MYYKKSERAEAFLISNGTMWKCQTEHSKTTDVKRQRGFGRRLLGSVEQRVLRPDQLADMHGHITELVAEEAAQAHEGGRVSDELLRVRHHFAPVRRSRAGEQTQRSRSASGRSPARQP